MKGTLVLRLFVCASMAFVYRPESHHSCDTLDEGFICEVDKTRFWEDKTPFFSMGSKESRKWPANCEVDQVSYLGRHGARGSIQDDGEPLRQTLRLKVAPDILQKYPFLQDKTTKNPGMILMPLGKQQAYHAGIRIAQDYSKLAASFTPMVRTAPSPRVKDTILYLMQGFEDTREQFKGEDHTVWRQEDLKVVPHLLSSPFGKCLAFKPEYKQAFGTYERRAKKLQKSIVQRALGVKIPAWFNKQVDTMELLMNFCIVDTFTLINQKSIGRWCELLSPDFFQKTIDYPASVRSWYAGGPGNPYVPEVAIAWVKELGARLLDREAGIFTLGPEASPLGERIYVDGTHRENQEPILVALGLFDPLKPPSFEKYTPPEDMDGWSSSGITSLGGRLIVERLQCKGKTGPFVRFILQDGVRHIAKFSDLRTPGPGIYPVEKVLENVEQILEQARINEAQEPSEMVFTDDDDDDDDDDNAFQRIDKTSTVDSNEFSVEEAANNPIDEAGDTPTVDTLVQEAANDPISEAGHITS